MLSSVGTWSRWRLGSIRSCSTRTISITPFSSTHALSGNSRQPFEEVFEVGVIDLRKIAASERVGAQLDLRAERFQSEVVFAPTLLDYS